MSSAIALRITDAGLAMVSAILEGATQQISLSAVAMGEGFGAVTGAETAMRTEKIRVPIADASRPSPDCINLRANVKSATALWVREIGLFSGSVLFAYVASDDASMPLAYLPPNAQMVFSQDLYCKAITSDKITVVIDPNASALNSLIRLHEQAENPHGITQALATMLASQCGTNMLILINNYLKPPLLTVLDEGS
jgi:hypothetical protein